MGISHCFAGDVSFPVLELFFFSTVPVFHRAMVSADPGVNFGFPAANFTHDQSAPSFTSGDVIVRTAGQETPIHNLSEDDLAVWRGKTMGVVYQSFQLLPMLTLLENVMLPMDLCGRYQRGKSRQRAKELLEMVELGEHIHKPPAFISGGQQQRVAIARALANDPPILVADEPTGSLDSVTAEHIFELFQKLVKEQGKTIVMVTHEKSLVPRFTRHLEISDGALAPRNKNQAPDWEAAR
jgi:putative ABC transport system ATP-binding protein